MLPWFCIIIDHRRNQNVVRTSVTNSAAPREQKLKNALTYWMKIYP